ncbi:hypothetical protein D3C85_1018950 [compost metagenome]
MVNRSGRKNLNCSVVAIRELLTFAHSILQLLKNFFSFTSIVNLRKDITKVTKQCHVRNLDSIENFSPCFTSGTQSFPSTIVLSNFNRTSLHQFINQRTGSMRNTNGINKTNTSIFILSNLVTRCFLNTRSPTALQQGRNILLCFMFKQPVSQLRSGFVETRHYFHIDLFEFSWISFGKSYTTRMSSSSYHHNLWI